MRNHPAAGILGTVGGTTLEHLNKLCHARIRELSTEPAPRAWWEALAAAVKVAVVLLDCPELDQSDRHLIEQQLAIAADLAGGCCPEAVVVLGALAVAMAMTTGSAP